MSSRIWPKIIHLRIVKDSVCFLIKQLSFLKLKTDNLIKYLTPATYTHFNPVYSPTVAVDYFILIRNWLDGFIRATQEKEVASSGFLWNITT